MFGEVFVNVMVDYKVLFSGIYFELYVFEDWDGKLWEYFGLFVYKWDNNVFVIDIVGFKIRYMDEDWYSKI